MTLATIESDLLARADRLTTDLENYCVTGPFGNGAAISATAATYYRGLGRVIADALAIEPAALAAQPAPQLESLRRAALDAALTELLRGEVDAAVDSVRRHAQVGDTAVPDALAIDAAAWSAGAGCEFAHAWAGDPVAETLVRRFGETMSGRPEGSDIRIAAPSDGQRTGRAAAVAFLRRAVPVLSADVLACAPILGLFDGDLASAFATAAPLVVFVNSSLFDDRFLAAELLQHEALHQKLNDISLARALFRPDYVDADSATASVPWAMPGVALPRYFSADRCFAAYHVYSHQAVLYLGALARCTGTPELPAAVDRLVLSYARAAFFTEALQDPRIRAEWGADGARLAAWLDGIVAPLGEFVLPDGSRLRHHAGAHAARA